MNNDNFHPLPQPNEVSSREREDGMGAYLMMFASLGVGLPLPIINLIWLKGKSTGNHRFSH